VRAHHITRYNGGHIRKRTCKAMQGAAIIEEVAVGVTYIRCCVDGRYLAVRGGY
jgi:hypothetical protein